MDLLDAWIALRVLGWLLKCFVFVLLPIGFLIALIVTLALSLHIL